MEKLPTTIKECHEVIRLLLGKLEDLSTRFAVLEAENKKLKLEIAELKERLNNNSSNSSLPPSKDFKNKKKKSKHHASGKKSGGQPGHKGHARALLPVDQVDSVENCKLATECDCGGKIVPTGDYVRHQVHELPPLKLNITEYQLQKGCCENCRQKHVASLPTGITWGITGSRLTSFMSDLVTRFGLSRREQRLFLEEYFNFRISLGTVFKKQRVVNQAMAMPVSELLPIVKESKCVHSDETGHNRDGKNHWMWGFISSTAAYFSIHGSRGKKVLRAMMGDFKHILVSDRYCAYNMFASDKRQVCWAHLKRDFTKLSEKENKIIARIGKSLLVCESKLFKIWYEFKAVRITRDELLRQTAPIRRQVGELLEQGSYTDPQLRAVRFCKNLLENFNALWTFLEVDDIEPTNNLAERSLRPSVIWRKKYFCTRSDYGTEYVARSASINMTCKLQRKSPFKFLCTLLQNHFSGIQTSAFALIDSG